MPCIFITGTDTSVGKTFVTLLLAEALQKSGTGPDGTCLPAGKVGVNSGIDVGIMKPISCGSDNDAVYLKKALKLKDPIELINPINLKLPLSPYAAAKLERRTLNVESIFSAYKKLSKLHDLILVEGVGGALVPITENYYAADLARDLNAYTIIVARAGLGTINHTLLTIEALKKHKVNILGIIMNGYKGNDQSEKSNSQIIAKLSKVPILAEIPWQKK